MISYKRAVDILTKMYPVAKPSGRSYRYKNLYLIELIGKNQDSNDRYLDSLFKVDRNTGEAGPYSRAIDGGIDPDKLIPIH